MLRRPEGATIAQIVEATGWQPHTVRGAFAGALKKKLGLEVTSEKARAASGSTSIGNEQIDASLEDELKRMRSRRARPEGESATHCAECEEPIPEARRRAIPGVKLCIDCQSERDARPVIRGGINRRGSKDSQLK
jgi:phage/conjugal plasmid C-4 type zinc finger TraR family protein